MNDYMYMNKDVSEPEVESEGDSDGRDQYVLGNCCNRNHLRPETFEAPKKSMDMASQGREHSWANHMQAHTACRTAQHSHMVSLSCQDSVKRCRNWYNILHCVATQNNNNFALKMNFLWNDIPRQVCPNKHNL